MGIFLMRVMVIHSAAARVIIKAPVAGRMLALIIPLPTVFITLFPRYMAPKNSNTAPMIRALRTVREPLPTVVPTELPMSLAAMLKAM